MISDWFSRCRGTQKLIPEVLAQNEPSMLHGGRDMPDNVFKVHYCMSDVGASMVSESCFQLSKVGKAGSGKKESASHPYPALCRASSPAPDNIS